MSKLTTTVLAAAMLVAGQANAAVLHATCAMTQPPKNAPAFSYDVLASTVSRRVIVNNGDDLIPYRVQDVQVTPQAIIFIGATSVPGTFFRYTYPNPAFLGPAIQAEMGYANALQAFANDYCSIGQE